MSLKNLEQTSVEFLEKKFVSIFVNDEGFKITIEQANAIREKELSNAYNQGWEDAMKEAIKEIYKHQ